MAIIKSGIAVCRIEKKTVTECEKKDCFFYPKCDWSFKKYLPKGEGRITLSQQEIWKRYNCQFYNWETKLCTHHGIENVDRVICALCCSVPVQRKKA